MNIPTIPEAPEGTQYYVRLVGSHAVFESVSRDEIAPSIITDGEPRLFADAGDADTVAKLLEKLDGLHYEVVSTAG